MPNNRYDWVGLMRKTRQAYRPDVAGTAISRLGQGFVGRRIAEDELRKAIMTTMMGKYTPMVGEEPATMEQVMKGMRPPGPISRLFGAKPPEEITWKPIPTEWKPRTKEEKLEVIRAGKIEQKEFEYILKSALAEQRHAMELELTKLKAELKGPLDEATRRLKEEQTKRLEKGTELFYGAEEETPEGKWYERFIFSVLEKLGVNIPRPKTPTEVGVQGELPGMEGVPPIPTPTEALIPDWLPEDVKTRLRALQETGATEEEIREIINYYRR